MARQTIPIASANAREGTVRSGRETLSPGMASTNVVVSPAVPRRPKKTTAMRAQYAHEDWGLVGDRQHELRLDVGRSSRRERCVDCHVDRLLLLGARGPKAEDLADKGGAARNSTISDWTTRTMSMGVEVAACIEDPPARSPPIRMPANTTPIGLLLPSSATVMASNPISPAIPLPSAYSVAPPRIWLAPAMPARPPAITMTPASARLTLIPAVRAAFGLAPTARNSNPMVERSRSHQTKAAAPRASRNPRFSR